MTQRANKGYRIRTRGYEIGTRVIKCTGDYRLGGEIRAAFTTKAGKLRYVVEHTPLAPGLLHIYAPRNLRRVVSSNKQKGRP